MRSKINRHDAGESICHRLLIPCCQGTWRLYQRSKLSIKGLFSNWWEIYVNWYHSCWLKFFLDSSDVYLVVNRVTSKLRNHSQNHTFLHAVAIWVMDEDTNGYCISVVTPSIFVTYKYTYINYVHIIYIHSGITKHLTRKELILSRKSWIRFITMCRMPLYAFRVLKVRLVPGNMCWRQRQPAECFMYRCHI